VPRRRILVVVAGLIALLATLLVWLGRQSARRGEEDPSQVAIETRAAKPRSSAFWSVPSAPPIQLNQAGSQLDSSAEAGLFEGRVISSATGVGVAGAEITFEQTRGAFSVRSGMDGVFQFQPPQVGQYRLAAIAAEGFLPFAPEWGRSPITLIARQGERIRDIVLLLTPAVEYVGTVLDAVAQPIPGVQVRLLDPFQGENGLAMQAAFISDEAGKFRFRAPPWAWLEASHPNYARARRQVDASVQASRSLELRLDAEEAEDATAALSGHVLDAQESPVWGATVSARQRRRGRASTFPTTTRADGRFELNGLVDGEYEVTATYPGLVSAHGTAHSGTHSLVLKLSDGARLRGIVTDRATRAPVVAFTVSVQRLRGPLVRDTLTSSAFMDPQGQYEVSGLPPGSYAAVVAGYGYAPSAEKAFTISNPSDAQVADFELERGGELFGQVVDRSSGSPVEAAQLHIESQLSSVSPVSFVASGFTDASGQYTLHGLASGLGSVSVSAAGHHTRLIAGLQFENGQRTGPLRIDLKPLEQGETPSTEMEGIGAVLAARDDVLVVSRLVAGGGALAAGLAVGDEIVSVDSRPVVQLGFNGAVQRIRGPEGSCVPLTVRRASDQQVAEVMVCRRRVTG
jgi:hypothetical protein